MTDMPLFGKFDRGAKLARIEAERTQLMEALAYIAQEQKAISAKMRRLERNLRAELQHIEEHWVPEEQALTLEDVEKWCRSAFFNLAHTMPSNPHCYFSRRHSRSESMYERVVGFVIQNGYPQRYGKRVYTVLDVRLHSGVWFVWPMTDDPAESEVLNLKPDSMRPEDST